jgi:hypothetical protein
VGLGSLTLPFGDGCSGCGYGNMVVVVGAGAVYHFVSMYSVSIVLGYFCRDYLTIPSLGDGLGSLESYIRWYRGQFALGPFPRRGGRGHSP